MNMKKLSRVSIVVFKNKARIFFGIALLIGFFSIIVYPNSWAYDAFYMVSQITLVGAGASIGLLYMLSCIVHNFEIKADAYGSLIGTISFTVGTQMSNSIVDVSKEAFVFLYVFSVLAVLLVEIKDFVKRNP